MGIYDNVNEIHKSIIIKFGETIYSSLGLHNKTDDDIIKYMNEPNDFKGKIKESFIMGKTIGCEELEHYKNKIKDLENDIYNIKNDEELKYAKYINELKEHNQIKEDKIQEFIKLNQDIYHKGLQEGKQYNNMLLEEKNKQIIDKDELIELYRPKIYDNMKVKGDEVENIICDSFVRQIDRMAYVNDTSDIKGSGDRIITFSDYKMMIECKNKKVITKADIEQFKDHYTTDFIDKKYDVALFLSYNCQYILGKGSFKIEKQGNNIIGYIGISEDVSVEQKENIILYFVTIINDMFNQNLKSNHKYENYQDHLLKSVLEIYNDILTIEKYELPYIDIINQKYENKKKKLNEYIIKFDENNIPLPLELQSINGTEDIFINKLINKINIIDYIIPKQNWRKTLISDYNLDEFYIKLLNKKGITREKIVEKYNEIYNKNNIID